MQKIQVAAANEKSEAGLTRPQYVVDGGQPLRGTIELAGAKNAATKILLATMLSEEPSVLENVPALGDTAITAELLRHIGSRIDIDGHRWRVATPTIEHSRVPALTRKNRIPILCLGPLLNRSGQAEVPILGGDAIGPRPVEFHLDALRVMGAEISLTPTSYQARTNGLHGAVLTLPYPSVGTTENIMLAAVLATGQTIIRNAAVEPEVLDLMQMLQTMGAIIELGSDRRVYIEGVPRLRGTTYRIMPDRNEAVSFACLALATGGDITVRGARQDHLMTWLNTVRRLGAQYAVNGEDIRFWRDEPLRAIAVETDTHPGFMTDWQQPLVTVLTQAAGQSTVHETVYEDRFGYTKTLATMGANLTTSTECYGKLSCRFVGHHYVHSCQVVGPRSLHGGDITIPDIRAGMAHLIAALTARGESRLHGIDHLDRGYENLDHRLQFLGARLRREGDV